jgi:hypothetical protein
MQKFKSEKILVSIVEDTICNKCGESCGEADYPHGLIEAEVHGGYSSPVLCDGHGYKFSLCESCLAQLFKGFKISALNPARSSCGCTEDNLE